MGNEPPVAPDNVVHVPFNPRKHKELSALYVELKDTIYRYAGEVPFAGVLGILQMLQLSLYNEAMGDEDEE